MFSGLFLLHFVIAGNLRGYLLVTPIPKGTAHKSYK